MHVCVCVCVCMCVCVKGTKQANMYAEGESLLILTGITSAYVSSTDSITFTTYRGGRGRRT